MQYLVFRTPTTLDIRAVTIFGLHAKPNSKNPIGYFGTGLKMAIATLVRHNIKVLIDIVDRQYGFRLHEEKFRDVQYDQIVMHRRNGLSQLWAKEDLPYTTELARNWKLWMAFRELESNTRDEGGTTQIESLPIKTNTGETCIIIELTPDMEAVYSARDTIFLPGGLTQVEANESIQVFHKPSQFIYYRSMRVLELEKPSVMTYNILAKQELTEDRTLKDQWYLPYQIARMFMESHDSKAINHLMNATDENYEHELPWDSVSVDVPSPEFIRIINQRVRAENSYSTSRSYSPTPLYSSARMDTVRQKVNTPEPNTLVDRIDFWLGDYGLASSYPKVTTLLKELRPIAEANSPSGNISSDVEQTSSDTSEEGSISNATDRDVPEEPSDF